MGKINILSRQVADLIAAGEVVERPASVVKELLENSFDAGADNITVEIQNGGVRLIRVTDNGEGMSREDAERAFMLHATSKIKSAFDLEEIKTLGFRGEALASIASVSKIELITRTKDEEFGTHLVIDGGKLETSEEIGCGVGSVITVSDLFYNTPARLKFLKKDIYEAGKCCDAAIYCALGRENVSVKFIKDGKVQFQTNAESGFLNCIYGIFGRDVAKSLLEVNYESHGFRISGFVSKPEDARGNRQLQNFFVNGRFAKAKILTAALEAAYSNRITTGRYPFCFLKIEADYRGVDVNVHPAKTEVRFSRERDLFDAVYSAAISAIDALNGFSKDGARYSPKISLGEVTSGSQIKIGQENPNKVFAFSTPLYKDAPGKKAPGEMSVAQNTISVQSGTVEIPSVFFEAGAPKKTQDYSPSIDLPDPRTAQEETEQDDTYGIVGEALGLYIIVEKKDELLLIDKHAAHERMLFDRLKAQGEISSQVLLMPETITVLGRERAAIIDNLGVLFAMGFEVEDFGGNSLIIRRMPAILNVEQGKAALLEIAQTLLDTQRADNDIYDELYHSIACRGAIKANAKNSAEELSEIVEAVLKYKSVRYCPHGRPVAVSYSRHSIDKQFMRN